MKILMIHPHDLFSHTEPWSIRIKALAHELKKLGHDITLLTFTLDGFEKEPFWQEGIRYLCLSRKLSLRYFFKKIKIMSSQAKEHDLVFFQKCFHYSSVPAVISAFLNKKWLHYDWDDNETSIFFSGKKIPSYITGFALKILEKFLPSVADSCSVSSDNLFKMALKNKADRNYLVKVPVGSYEEKFSNEIVEKIKIRYDLIGINQIYIGQLHGAQYAELLIKTCLKLKNEGIKTKTLIVGDGNDRNRLEQIVKDNHLENDVVFTGAVEHMEVFHYLKSCQIAVACFEENTVTVSKSPLKIAEYLNAGKAIVAHKVGEVPYMLGEAGIYADPKNPDSLFDELLKLHKNPEIISIYENLALKQSVKFRWESSAKILHNLFLKAIPQV